MIFTRYTLVNPVQFDGLGLHSGIPVTMTVHPGEQGIVFRFGSHRVTAHPANVTDTTRSTKLGEIGTVEHLMSAFAGLGITDAEVELDAPEVPGMDGSAAPYVEALRAVGLSELGQRELPTLFGRVFLQEENGTKVAVGKGEGHWRYEYKTGNRFPGEQIFESLRVQDEFAAEIAPARTFALAEEVPHLIQLGLGQGLDESSAVILGIEGYKNEVRFPDEPARHKLLDLIGDLYLAGVPPMVLNVVAERSGHRANVKVAAMLADALQITA